MKTRLLLTLLGALTACAVGLSGTAVAQGQGGGGGKGGGGGGGGGSPAPPDYGDLIILYRNDYGVPILDGNGCQQAIGFQENIGCPDLTDYCVGGTCLLPRDADTCAILPAFGPCTKEADFGRMNLARAKPDVLRSQLEDVKVNLAIADCTSLDPAGRMVYSRFSGGDLLTGTVDSPLQNLAVYKYLMLTGDIGVSLPQDAGVLETAARGLGVAIEKAGEFNIDLAVYLNRIMGLTDPDTDTILRKECIFITQEVMGEVKDVEECFLDYTQYATWYQEGAMTGYSYHRGANFGHPDPDVMPAVPGLPLPAYSPFGDPQIGTFEFLWDYALTVEPIIDVVFTGDLGETIPNIGGLVQAADDTRAVINFMHEHPLPPEDVTPVTCTPPADPDVLFDLSISERSGLQVPKQVIATTEGREFVVTVNNAGPQMAAGTLTVTAETAEGPPVLAELGNGWEEGPFVFTFGEVTDELSCTIEEGIFPTLSWTTGPVYFVIGNPGDDHVATKITWTADVVPVDCAEDPVEQDPVVKVSNVRVTGGGGH